ncbi:hypothetical protein ACLOJK_027501 [Asimina triloba]
MGTCNCLPRSVCYLLSVSDWENACGWMAVDAGSLDHAAAIIWKPITVRFHGFKLHPLLLDRTWHDEGWRLGLLLDAVIAGGNHGCHGGFRLPTGWCCCRWPRSDGTVRDRWATGSGSRRAGVDAGRLEDEWCRMAWLPAGFVMEEDGSGWPRLALR